MQVNNKEIYFKKAFDKYSKDIFRYVKSKISTTENAEDITSDVFIKFWYKISDDQKILNDKAMLYTIAHGLVIDHYRKKNASVSIDDIDQKYLSKEAGLEKNLILSDEISELKSKMSKLKQEYTDILELYYIEQLDISEISSILNKKEGTVRVLAHRALSSLKKLYE